MSSRKRIKSESKEDDCSKMAKCITRKALDHMETEDTGGAVMHTVKYEVKKESKDDSKDDVRHKMENKMKGNKRNNKKGRGRKDNDESNKKVNNKRSKISVKKEINDDSTKNSTPLILGLSNHGNLLVKNMPKWKEISCNNDSDENNDTLNSFFTDTTIITIDQRRFLVHSVILSAGSQQLKKDLMGQDKEKYFKIELEDVTGSELVQILNYIYEGRVEVTDAQEEQRLKELVDQYGLITTPVADIVRPDADAKEAFLEELRKGGVIKIGKGGKCLDCGRDFGEFSNAKRHYDTLHMKPADISKFTCPICDKKNAHLIYLERHLREKHGIRKGDIITAKKEGEVKKEN